MEIDSTIASCYLGTEILAQYLLWWRDALLLIELGALFGFAVQAEALFKGLLLQHQSGA